MRPLTRDPRGITTRGPHCARRARSSSGTTDRRPAEPLSTLPSLGPLALAQPASPRRRRRRNPRAARRSRPSPKVERRPGLGAEAGTPPTRRTPALPLPPLRAQKPESEMAETWLMEHGLLPEEEQKKAHKKMLAGKSAPAKRPASASKPRPPAAKKPKTEPGSAKPKKAVAVDDDDSDDDAPLASLKRSGEGGGFTIPQNRRQVIVVTAGFEGGERVFQRDAFFYIDHPTRRRAAASRGATCSIARRVPTHPHERRLARRATRWDCGASSPSLGAERVVDGVGDGARRAPWPATARPAVEPLTPRSRAHPSTQSLQFCTLGNPGMPPGLHARADHAPRVRRQHRRRAARHAALA